MRSIIFTREGEHVADCGIEFTGKIKKHGRLLIGALALMMVAACDPVPVGDTTCESALACEVVQLTAKEVRRDIGKDYGGGVVLRNARALGQTLVVDASLPLSAAALKEPAGKNLIGILGKSFAKGFCEGDSGGRFFALGATVRIRGFSRDNVLVADQIVRSCGGRKR